MAKVAILSRFSEFLSDVAWPVSASGLEKAIWDIISIVASGCNKQLHPLAAKFQICLKTAAVNSK